MTTSPTAQFLAEAITASGKTQREIAERTGFEKPNIIAMMKTVTEEITKLDPKKKQNGGSTNCRRF